MASSRVTRADRPRARCRNADSLRVQRERANKRERERTKVSGARDVQPIVATNFRR